MSLTGCHDKFLDLKSDQGKVIPSKLEDFKKMIDNDGILNNYSLHFLMNISADEYYVTEIEWNQLSGNYEKNGYIWAKDIYAGGQCPGWNRAFQKILYANVVLEGVELIDKTSSNTEKWNSTFGSALFFRAWTFYQLAQVFCEDYSPQNLSKPGIPLKLSSDINQKVKRATIEETYKQIISDLLLSIELLPINQPYRNRPNKAIAHAVLAKVYLQMEDYPSALVHAENYLKDFKELIDFNTLDPNLMYPFPLEGLGNVELPYFEYSHPTVILGYDRVRVDTILYAMYDENDLRKDVYFYEKDGKPMYGGSYSGFDFLTCSPATNEMYLIASEASVRLGNIEKAQNYLNGLLLKRYKTGTFTALEYDSNEELLLKILEERRKELVLKGTRWSDLRRFKKDGSLKKDLKRRLGDNDYTLSPSGLNWIWPIPSNAIDLGGYEQNVRE